MFLLNIKIKLILIIILMILHILKKNFPEVYEKTLAVNKLKTTKIDNPFKPGTKINVRDLVKKFK